MAIGKLNKSQHPAPLVEQAGKRAAKGSSKPKRVNFEVDPATHAALKSRAAAQGETISDVLRKAVNEYLSK